jgi:5-methylcytosine-specific restriction endonuclease McrA
VFPGRQPKEKGMAYPTSKPSRGQARAHRKTIAAICQRLETIEVEHGLLKQETKALLADITKHVTELVNNTPHGEIKAVLHDIYWSSEILAGPILKVFQGLGLTKGKGTSESKVGTKDFPEVCKDCGEENPITFKSWQHYKDSRIFGFVCAECQKAREDRSEESRRESEERLRAWREEVAWLRQLPYKEYLQTDHWKTVRKYALQRAGFRCQLCHKKGELNTHHATYEHLGYEDQYIEDLVVLCKPCHRRHHGLREEGGGS